MIIFLAAGLFIYGGLIPAWKNVNSDFPNYYVSSKMILEKRDVSRIYDNQWFDQKIHEYGIEQKGKFAPFPPPTAFVFLPIALFEPITAKRIWTIVNLLLCIPVVYFFKKQSGLTLQQSVLFVLGTGMALINNFYLGQIYLLILLLMQIAISISGKYPTASGLISSLSVSVKYFPIVILPDWIIKKNWKAINGLLMGGIIIVLISFLFLGEKPCIDFVKSVLGNHLNSRLEGQSPYSPAFQSWDAFLKILFVKDDILNPNPLFDSLLIFYALKILIIVFYVALAIKLLIQITKTEKKAVYSYILFSFLIAILSPASASYHFLLLLPAIALFLKICDDTETKIVTLVFVLLCGYSQIAVDRLPDYLHLLPVVFYRLMLMNIFCVWMMRKMHYWVSS